METNQYLKKNLQKSSKVIINKMVDYLIENPEELRSLFDLIYEDVKESWRAAWVLSTLAEKRPDMLKKYAKEIISKIPIMNPQKTEAALNSKAAFIKVLTIIEFDYEECGLVYDECLNCLYGKHISSYQKYISIILLQKIVKQFPEAKPELISVIQDVLPILNEGYLIKKAKEILNKEK